MTHNTLKVFADNVAKDWGPLSTELVAAVRGHMETLLQAPATEAWLKNLRRDAPANQELLRDARHGFVLQAHTETTGLYRPPHDHGRSWVIYAVVEGESEMGTYGRVTEADGTVRLVKRGSTRVRAGDVQVYLPGDIHDTRCIAGPARQYRFTERDLKQEAITRFVDRNGVWVAP